MKTEIINLLQTTQALDGGNQGINARDVHRLLKVGRDYSKWIKARINQAGFIETTRQGGKNQCSLYALTCFPLNDVNKAGIFIKATERPSDKWKKSF